MRTIPLAAPIKALRARAGSIAPLNALTSEADNASGGVCE
jgi:hypothetical protein